MDDRQPSTRPLDTWPHPLVGRLPDRSHEDFFKSARLSGRTMWLRCAVHRNLSFSRSPAGLASDSAESEYGLRSAENEKLLTKFACGVHRKSGLTRRTDNAQNDKD